MSRKGVSRKDRVAVILGLARVGNSEFKDPAILVDRPEQPRDIPVDLIGPQSEHHPAPKEIRCSDEVTFTEVGMCVAVRPFDIRAGIRREIVSGRVELVF